MSCYKQEIYQVSQNYKKSFTIIYNYNAENNKLDQDQLIKRERTNQNIYWVSHTAYCHER